MRLNRILLSLTMASAMAFPALAGAGLGKTTASSPVPEWFGNTVIYEANLRQGTPEGNLRGLQRELPRLADLGVDVIWLMPIHPISEVNRKGTLGSYYAVRDYKAVNPEFGTMQDLQELVRSAHTLGMKVILDEVCNHTGCDNAWVTEHPEYYARNEKGEMYGPFDWTDTYKLDYSNPATREAMIDALEYWVREADIDGYRCDVAMEVPVDFWEEARPRLQAIKPVLMLAEASSEPLLSKAFDVDYAWPMKDVFNDIAATQGVNAYAEAKGQKRKKADARAIRKLLAEQSKDYPQNSIHMQMVTNHDLNSWEGTELERYGRGLGAFTVLSYTLPGVPMMYTGQEVGFNHAFEFFEADSIRPDYTANEYTAFYKMLNAMRHAHPALSGRNHAAPLFHDTKSDDILAFTREADGDKVIVIVNLSDKEQPLQFKGETPAVNGLTDYFTQAPATLPTTLAPWQFMVFTAE